MTDREDTAVNVLRSKLKQSRQEVSRLLNPPREERRSAAQPDGRTAFPRSRTMRVLLNSHGWGALGALAGGFLIARPRMALKLLRFLPKGAVTKTIIARLVGGQ